MRPFFDCFLAKSVLLQFTLFCCETCFVAVYALSVWRQITAKMLSVEKKWHISCMQQPYIIILSAMHKNMRNLKLQPDDIRESKPTIGLVQILTGAEASKTTLLLSFWSFHISQPATQIFQTLTPAPSGVPTPLLTAWPTPSALLPAPSVPEIPIFPRLL